MAKNVTKGAKKTRARPQGPPRQPAAGEGSLLARVTDALDIARRWGTVDGAHHKAWVIDQMVRALTACPIETRHVRDAGQAYSYEAYGESAEYLAFVSERRAADYDWSEGIAP